MADALTKNAPSKTEKKNGQPEQALLDMEFDSERRYMFNLARKNEIRDLPVVDMHTRRPAPVQEYNPYRNIIFSSQITWNGSRVNIRYYDGCDSIFVADQPKDKDTIDQFKAQTKKRWFADGKFGAYGADKFLLQYMFAASWNGDSPFKTRGSDTVWITADGTKMADSEDARLDQMLEAGRLAKEATLVKMMIHAAYLGIPTMDADSGNEMSEKEIRVLYRKEAAARPKEFADSYGNKLLEIKYYIDKALEKEHIKSTVVVGKATWGKANTIICDISGLKTYPAISEKLLEFSQTTEGEEFLVQLKSLYN